MRDNQYSLPIGVSARHVHLSQEHLEILFGKAYELTVKKELMGGQYAAHEQVTIVGTKLRAIENVRVLGPTRKQSQVEISMTDSIKLGIKASLRESGDTKGTTAITLVGPKGCVYLEEGCIVAKRHIHMSPSDAKEACVLDGDMVSVLVKTARQVTFDDVKVRVDPSFTLEMHIDVDEANSAGIVTGDKGLLI